MTTPNHTLLTEIAEQPQRLRQLLDLFPQAFEGITMPGFFTQKLIGIGEGSSYNALKIAAPYIEEFCGLNNFTFDPESLMTKFKVAHWVDQPIKRLFERSYFLTVSQSGKTSSILNIVQRLQEAFGFTDQYLPMLAFTNNTQGTLCQRYGNHVDLQAGAEVSIAATKSMTCSILALLLFGIRLGQKRSWLKRSTYQQLLETLKHIPDALQRVVENTQLHQHMQAFVSAWCETNQFIVLSKGLLSNILPEIGLKLTETSSNIVWTDNTESFKHGRKVILQGIKGIRPNCVYLIPPALSPTEAEQLFHDIHSHFYTGENQAFSTQHVFFVCFENSPPLPDDLKQTLDIQPQDVLTLPASQGIESLFVALLAFQLLSAYLAQAKGEDPNNPALEKAVTQ